MSAAMIGWSYVAACVEREVVAASDKHGTFHSVHEGHSILLEEMDELWDEIKLKDRDTGRMFDEAKQVAAMAMRFMLDLQMGRIK